MSSAAVIKYLLPPIFGAILNAAPTIVERRISNWLASVENCEEKQGISQEDTLKSNKPDDGVQASPFANQIAPINNASYGCLLDVPTYQQLIDENLTFNLVQVITLTTIPLSIILYYNLRIFRGINERQKLLVPFRRKFSQGLETKKERTNKLSSKFGSKIEEVHTVSHSPSYQKALKDGSLLSNNEQSEISNPSVIKSYPTISVLKQTIDTLTLPVTLPMIEVGGHQGIASNFEENHNTFSQGVSVKRRYEDKISLCNMVSVIQLLL